MTKLKKARPSKWRRENDPAIRREEILSAASELANKIGYQNITRDAVASLVGISSGLIALYFNTMAQLKAAVMRRAIEKEILPIIAQGLSLGDIQTQEVAPDLKKRVIEFLSN
jgi:AcrR family transcriptional regulator